MQKIANGDYQNLTIDEINQKVQAKHGNKALKYTIYKFNDTVAVSSGLFSIDAKKDEYINQILLKCHKYKDEVKKYNNFIILCNYTGTVEINQESDLDEMVDKIRSQKICNPFTIVILYDENDVVISKRI